MEVMIPSTRATTLGIPWYCCAGLSVSRRWRASSSSCSTQAKLFPLLFFCPDSARLDGFSLAGPFFREAEEGGGGGEGERDDDCRDADDVGDGDLRSLRCPGAEDLIAALRGTFLPLDEGPAAGRWLDEAADADADADAESDKRRRRGLAGASLSSESCMGEMRAREGLGAVDLRARLTVAFTAARGTVFLSGGGSSSSDPSETGDSARLSSDSFLLVPRSRLVGGSFCGLLSSALFLRGGGSSSREPSETGDSAFLLSVPFLFVPRS